MVAAASRMLVGGMLAADSRRLVVAGGVGLALVGLWVGHTVEYVRVWGSTGLQAELVGSLHLYMLPLGALLALGSALAGVRVWRAWCRLGRRIDVARSAVPALLRGHRIALPDARDGARPSIAAGIAVAWPALTALQVALYVAQENIEAGVWGYRPPGLGAIAGIHWLAPAVHAAVALVLLIVAALVLRLLRRRGAVVAAVEARVRALLTALLARASSAVAPTPAVARPPAHLLCHSLRQRPPPALLVTG